MATRKNVKRKTPPPGDRMRFLRSKAAAGTATEGEYRELEKLLAKSADATGGASLDAQTAFADNPPQEAAAGDSAADVAEPSAGSASEVVSDTAPPPPAKGATPPVPSPVHRLKAFFGKVPSPEKPPRMETKRAESDSKGRGGDWRKKYEEAAAGTGREATVLFFANRWLGGLTKMSDGLKLVGVDPLVDVTADELKGVLVITVDDFLPASVQLKPAHHAAFASTALMVQTFVHRKDIVEGLRKAKERGDQRKNVEAAAEAAKHAQEHNRTAVAPDPVSVSAQVATPNHPATPEATTPVVQAERKTPVALLRLGEPKPADGTPVIQPYNGPANLNPDDVF